MKGLVRMLLVAGAMLVMSPAANATDPPDDGMEIKIFVGLCEDPVTVVQFRNSTDAAIRYIVRVDEIEFDSGEVAANSTLHVDVETALGESHAIHARTFEPYSSEDAVADYTECESPTPPPSTPPPTTPPPTEPPPTETTSTPPPTRTVPPSDPPPPTPETGIEVAGFVVAGIGLLLVGTFILRRTAKD